jgi:hypothetical protein
MHFGQRYAFKGRVPKNYEAISSCGPNCPTPNTPQERRMLHGKKGERSMKKGERPMNKFIKILLRLYIFGPSSHHALTDAYEERFQAGIYR